MTTPLALQLRAIAARAPMLDRPAIAAAADQVDEVARLREDRDHYRNCISAREVRNIVDERDRLRADLAAAIASDAESIAMYRVARDRADKYLDERDEALALLQSLRSLVPEDYRHHIDTALAKAAP